MGTLVFIITLFSLVYCFAAMAYFLLKKKPQKVKRVIILASLIVVCYIALLLLFSLTSQSTLLPQGQDKCFDDWCAAITNVEKNSPGHYAVTFRITSHARGRAQKPDHPRIYVLDAQGNTYVEDEKARTGYESKFGAQRSIDSRIDPQSSFKTTMLFSLPNNRRGFVVITEGGFPTPLLIGDEGSLLHKKSITPLE